MNGKYQTVSLFDLDHTLLKANSSYCFGSYLYRRGYTSKIATLYFLACYGLHKIGLVSMQSIHQLIFSKLFEGRSKSLFQDLAQAFAEENFDTMINQEAFKRLQIAKSSRHLTGILSSGPDFLVEVFARKLDLHFWAGTEYKIDCSGHFFQMGKVLDGTRKKMKLQEISNEYRIPLESSIVYSDSYHDIPFLEAAGKAVGVNPDFKLKALCRKNGWEVI